LRPSRDNRYVDQRGGEADHGDQALCATRGNGQHRRARNCAYDKERDPTISWSRWFEKSG